MNHTPEQVDYLETFYEVVAMIESQRNADEPHPAIKHINDTQGTGGFWELAIKLTDQFEQKYSGKQWDGEYFDTLEEYLNTEIK